MKRLMVFFFAALLVHGIAAQHTEIYSSADAAYTDGVTLYQQGQYAAAYRYIDRYLQQSLPLQYRSEATFYKTAIAYELRQKDALKQLQSYKAAEPYSTYMSETEFMIGVLQTEKGKYKQALKAFAQVKPKELFRQHQPDYLFYKGYAHLEMGETQQALSCFNQLKRTQNLYTLQAKYYAAFCHYSQGNYAKALPDFLAIEHTQAYRNIVPYYIIQIYYAQKQYDEVYERAEYLLDSNPENENNGELHRMLGEIHYQEGRYDKAVEHLGEYERLSKVRQQSLVRNDIYLLGMSYYRLSDWGNAVRYLNNVKKERDELSENTCYHLGNAYANQGQIEAAKMAYSAAMRYKLNARIREEAMYNYALTTYKSSSALGESVSAFTDFLKEYPGSEYETQVYELLCDVFMTSKNYQAALGALDSIAHPTTQMQETKQYLRYQLGTDAFLQGKTDVAIRYLTAVIDNEKKTSVYKTESYFWRAESEYKRGSYAQAQADYEQFCRQPNADKSKNYAVTDYAIGYALFAQQQYAAALEYFTAYVSHADPSVSTYIDALNRQGDCYFTARDYVRAEGCYAKAVSIGGTGVDYALFQRGCSLGLLKRYSDKINVLEKLVKQYPKSDYADDALYEIARAELQRNNDNAAITSYERLLSVYPHSNMARKASLEKAMIYYNLKNYDAAITSYKQVIKNYPGSEEAYAALDGLQSAYIETNNVNEYLAYTKTLGRINMTTDSREDSLTYVAAERQYMLGNYKDAVAGLGKYVSQYCTGGRYCTSAQYYFADSHYQLGQRKEASEAYKVLTEIQGNPYMEEACMRVAEIAYDEKDYATALTYFRRLQEVAGSIDKENIARLGILRCSYYLEDHATTIDVAGRIIDDVASSATLVSEARYNRGRAYYAQGQYEKAAEDLQTLATDVRTQQGAESKYLLGELAFVQDDLDKAEAEVMEFAGMNTQHQYWLAKSFVLLSDIYVKRGDDFQAKQYLLSLQSNYRTQDNIQDIIEQRLAQIEERETEKVADNEEDF